MISVEWNKQSLNSFYSKMNKLLVELPKRNKIGVENAMENVQEKALKNKRGNKDKRLIPIEIVDFDSKQVVGRVYTDKDLFSCAPFLEYGTGTKAELPHIGKTFLFKYSGFYCWYAPADKVRKQYKDTQFMDINGEMFPMNAYIGNAKYVMVFSQKPQPFMRPASFSSRQESADCINEEIGKLFMEVLK